MFEGRIKKALGGLVTKMRQRATKLAAEFNPKDPKHAHHMIRVLILTELAEIIEEIGSKPDADEDS